jgi:hypothetical protein
MNQNGFKTRAGACCPIILDTDVDSGDVVAPFSSFAVPDTSGGDHRINLDCAAQCTQSCWNNDIGQGRCWPCYPPTVLERLDCTHWKQSDLASLTVQGRKLWTNPCGYGSFPGYRLWKANAPEDRSLFHSQVAYDEHRCREGLNVPRCVVDGGDSFADLLSSVYGEACNHCDHGPFFKDDVFCANPGFDETRNLNTCGHYQTLNFVAPSCNNVAGYPLNCGPGSKCGCGPCCSSTPNQAGGFGFAPFSGLGYTQGCGGCSQ